MVRKQQCNQLYFATIAYIKYEKGEIGRKPAFTTIVKRIWYYGLYYGLKFDESEPDDITAMKAQIEIALGAAAAVEVMGAYKELNLL